MFHSILHDQSYTLMYKCFGSCLDAQATLFPSHRNNGERCRQGGGAGRRAGGPHPGGHHRAPGIFPLGRLACTPTGTSSSPGSSCSASSSLLFWIRNDDAWFLFVSQFDSQETGGSVQLQPDHGDTGIDTHSGVSHVSVLHVAVGHFEELHFIKGKAGDGAQWINVSAKDILIKSISFSACQVNKIILRTLQSWASTISNQLTRRRRTRRN